MAEAVAVFFAVFCIFLSNPRENCLSFFQPVGYNESLPVKLEVFLRMPAEPKFQPAHLSANTLAFVGDAVFALFVRERLSKNASGTVHRLHQLSTMYVKASAQARIAQGLAGSLTEEEMAIYRRGRNVKTTTMPRNAEMHEYRQATGFEALLGFLHMEDRKERLEELLEKSATMIEEETTGLPKNNRNQ